MDDSSIGWPSLVPELGAPATTLLPEGKADITIGTSFIGKTKA
nr:hypothetical protein VDP59_011440 [Xanthomonas campestris pv. campestris]